MKNREYKNVKNRAEVLWDYGMFEKLNLRIVRFELSSGEYETIITSLPRDKFPLEEIKKLYGMR